MKYEYNNASTRRKKSKHIYEKDNLLKDNQEVNESNRYKSKRLTQGN